MNKYLLIIVFMLSMCSVNFSQEERDFPKHKEGAEKIFQLEKIKLIEVLELDEETAIRFFVRRSESKKKTDEIQNKLTEIIGKLDAMDKGGKVYTENEIKAYINEYNSLHAQLGKERNDFINSLNDILTYNQIGRLIVFERKFKNELRKALFKERKRYRQETNEDKF